MSSAAPKLEPGRYYVLEPDGKLISVEEYEPKSENFKLLIKQEVYGEKPVGKPSAHIALMKKLKLAERDDLSDAGHLRLLPRGAVVMELIADRAKQIAQELGAYPMKTSTIYNLDAKPIKEHARLFGMRMYKVKGAKKAFVMRYAACFGQFSALSSYILSYKNLPLAVFELADSYRYEQRGELRGLTRVRRFHMPDIHVLCRDVAEAERMFTLIVDRIFEEARLWGWSYESLYNVVTDFAKSDWDFVAGLARAEGKPVLIKAIEPGKYYWVVNVEYNYIDDVGHVVESATAQIDIGNAKRFGITYRDSDGSLKHPVIIHTAIIGSLERFLADILSEAAKMEKRGAKPMLPVWLSPVQVRFVPLKTAHVRACGGMAAELAKKGFRADVDDRNLTVAKRVMEAEREWVPYVVVVGERELKSGKLSVRVRSLGKTVEMSLDELASKLESDVGQMPRRPLAGSPLLSRRPPFA